MADKYINDELKDTKVQVKLKDICAPIKRKNPNIDLPVMTISAGNGFLNQTERFNRVIANNSLSKYIHIKKGELSYNRGASKNYPYGICYTMEEESGALIPYVYRSFKVNDNINAKYIEQYFVSGRINRELRKIITSSVRDDGLLNISEEQFYNIDIKIHDKDVQDKVAKLLSSIDDLIDQSLQLENLYNLKKKKYMQLMLNDSSPKFRFNGYTKKWNKYSVSDKYTVIQGLTYKSSDENPNGNVNILRSNSIYDSKLKLENIVKINATNTDNIKFVEQGDVLICLSNGSKNLVGKTAIIDHQLENFAHGAFMGVVRGENSLFFHYLMNSSSGQKAISTSMGSTINNISKGNLEKFEFYFPEIGEMRKISNFLGLIDELVDDQKKITEEYKQLKKYHLNNIFN